MHRRHFLKRLLQTSSGCIGVSFLAGCGQPIDPLFRGDLLNPATPLPEHLLTPLSEFYVQSYALPPSVDADLWRLEIMGAVAKPLHLSFKDVIAAAQERFYLTMECIGNPAGGNLIGNAQWTGTPLLPFLQRAGIQPEATEFVLHGADFYETTLPVATVMRTNVCLVHQMNQAPLTQEHGYPVRLIVPGHFGQKQPKWLVKLEAIARPKQGYWERQGWSNTAEIPTHSLMQQVQNTRVWNKQHQVSLSRQGKQGWQQGVLLAGVALDKSRPIRQVQVSFDDGKTWQMAERNRPASPHEWTLWRYLWQPDRPGTYTLLAQAQSERETQPVTDAEDMDGSSGSLKVSVTLLA